MPARKKADDDPVINEFDVYLTRPLVEKYFLLQFPTRQRERPYNEEFMTQPLEVRMKPRTGFLELDVPMTPHMNHDQVKAANWGDALAKNQQATKDGYGLAVGFTNARGSGSRRAGAASPDDDDMEVDAGLERQTIGGQMILDEQGKPNYMIGTFLADKRELHLTEVAGVVQMRPQFHHIDAAVLAYKTKLRVEKDGGDVPASKSAPVQMAYTSIDQDQSNEGNTRLLLQAATEEPWKKLIFHDEEDSYAYKSYCENLFLPQAQQDTELMSTMKNDKYLDAISAPRLDHRGQPRTKPMTKRQKAQIEMSDHENSDAEKEATAADAGSNAIPYMEPSSSKT